MHMAVWWRTKINVQGVNVGGNHSESARTNPASEPGCATSYENGDNSTLASIVH